MVATLRHVARHASFFCLPVEAGENGAKESTSATVHHDGCAGVWHAGSAELARNTHQQRRMVLGWCWEHPQPPPPAPAASAPRWRLVCCRMEFQSIFLTRASFKLSHILYDYFKPGEASRVPPAIMCDSWRRIFPKKPAAASIADNGEGHVVAAIEPGHPIAQNAAVRHWREARFMW